ncbi:LapA family protein [Dysgonomonas sp. 216]|uniref:LapA family protein n=1 Tax=Dysgonomonas sp. 216 TaxID=2302934 RepID=UPI0013D43EAF|nr:LapA family protein [Dysgonomonas sp. 216]NDW19860.1 LapA family protein [Dysgonomonas sp. 216]
MMHRVSITTYRFVEPSIITEKDFYKIKELIRYNPEYTYNPFTTESFYEIFKPIIIGLGIGVIGLFLTPLWEFFAAISLLIFVFFIIYLVTGGIATLISVFRLKHKEQKYKDAINKAIRETDTYQLMLIKFKRYYNGTDS